MSNALASTRKKAARITLAALHQELLRLRQRVEDLEDLRELNDAVARNTNKKLVPWTDAKKELGLDD